VTDAAATRVAVVQFAPQFGQMQANIEYMVAVIRRAIESGTDLLVFPELATSGYMFASRVEAFGLAEPIPGGVTCQAILDVIRNGKLHVVVGICERSGGRLFNSAALLGPHGFIGRYRKLHLWNREKLYFQPGDMGLPIFRLPFGRVGIMICYDAWFPETVRILKLQGADIICDPSCWDLVPGEVQPVENLRPYVHLAQAHINHVFIACADRCGVERGCTFAGSSCVVGPTEFMAGPASASGDVFLHADVDLSRARCHQRTELDNAIADRRSDVYAQTLGYHAKVETI